jgi:hypothetical protein
MGNLDFTNQPGFSWYCLLLLGSGVAMVVLALLRGQSKGSRIANLIFGLGFCGYGFYLTFMFQGGSYFIFFKAFILPVVLIVNTFRSAAAKRNQKTVVQQPVANQAFYAQQQAQFAQMHGAQDAAAYPIEPVDGTPGPTTAV